MVLNIESNLGSVENSLQGLNSDVSDVHQERQNDPSSFIQCRDKSKVECFYLLEFFRDMKNIHCSEDNSKEKAKEICKDYSKKVTTAEKVYGEKISEN